MKKIRFYCYISLVYFFASCDRNIITTQCKSVNSIQVKDYCYNDLIGLSLVATGQDVSQNENQFIWYLYPQIDTTKSSTNVSRNNERILLGLNSITIQDSLIKAFPKFILRVTSSCSKDQVTSEYFYFIKRYNVGSKCYSWQIM